MQKSWLAAGILGLLAAGIPTLALAEGTVTMLIGGEAFEGPPKFAVSLGGTALGEAVVDSAIDTATAGRFADAADKGKYVQSFSFKIPDAAFKPDAELAIKLTNEAHGAAGSKQDRELYVSSIEVNGQKLAGSALGMRSSIGIEPTAMLGDYLVISEGQVEGVAAPPKGGWPKAAAPVADVPKPAEKPAAIAVAEAAKPATPPVEPAAKQVASAELPTTDAVPVAADPAPADDVTTASANPAPEGDLSNCNLDKSFAITGFNENSNDLTPRVQKQLDRIAVELAGQKCAVRLFGYSSTEGDFAHNALFAIERARNSLHYLVSNKGVKFRRYSASGVGETRQFGPDANANRRVVVTISP